MEDETGENKGANQVGRLFQRADAQAVHAARDLLARRGLPPAPTTPSRKT